MIPFNVIPANYRLPLFFAELDNSQANTFSGENQRTLIISQMLVGGVAMPNVPRISSGYADAIVQGGAGSMLALMVDRYRQNDTTGELWTCALADDGAAVAATGSVQYTAQATAAGTQAFYVGDVAVPVAVTPTMTLANLATALIAAVNANPNLPVTAAVDGAIAAKVNFTAKNAGLSENDIPLANNVGGVMAGEALPTGLAMTITALSGGATNPSLTAALANLMDMPFDFIIIPYNDATSLNAIQALLNDTAGRWSFNRQVYGHGFCAMKGNLSAATTLGASRNDQHMTILAENASPTPHWLWAAAYVGAAAPALRADPGRPVQTLVVQAVTAAPLASRFANADRNALLFSGISTFTVNAGGQVALENLITTYQKNAFNQPDNSYLEIETMFQLMWLLRDLSAWVTSRWSRVKLAKSGARLAPGSGVVTTDQIKADVVAHYRDLEYQGRAQDADTFEQFLIVEKNANNPDRVDMLWPGEVMDQLRQFAVLAQFRQ